MSHRISFHDQISRNKWKSTFLLISIVAILILLAYAISFAIDPDFFMIIMIAATVISILYVWVGYYNSHKVALASVNAKPAKQSEYSQYHHSVEGLCLASGMPKPKLYVMEDNNINAFASGRDPKNAVICVTTGAIDKLDKQELEGVLAHELSHIANYDIRFMTLTAVLVGMIAIISQIFLRSLWWQSIAGSGRDRDNKAQIVFIIVGIILAIIAPIVVQLVQLAISRKREYAADANGVILTRYPEGLASALEKIQHDPDPLVDGANRATAHLFISTPFKGKKRSAKWSTHPPISDRIRRLREM